MKKDNRRSILTAPRTLKHVLDRIDSKMTGVFLPWAIRRPRYLRGFVRLSRAYKRTEQSRAKALANGLKVPPFFILSITQRCNLHCAGCYTAAAGTVRRRNSNTHIRKNPTLNQEQWRAIIKEASELGVFCFIIAGGEPFLFPGLIDLCKEFKDRLFLIFTNGTVLTNEDYKLLKFSTNIAIIVSVEGGSELTNARRGQGVYEQALKTFKKLDKIGVLSGISVTINRMNFKYWMNTRHIDRFIAEGIRLGFFIEYIPLTPPTVPKPGTSNQPAAFCSGTPDPDDNTNECVMKNDHVLMLTKEERAKFRSQILSYRATKSIYLIHSPGDEEFFGGCISAGRGFAHVTPAGDLTPCPVSNVATHNLTNATLREGLASLLFKEIRENEHLLETEGMPCALFAHPREVDALAKAVGAYRTDIEQK